MAEEQINIEILLQTAKSAKSVEELEDSIKNLKDAATQIGAGGKGFDELVNTAGNLKRKIEDVEQSVDKASKGFKGLQNFVNIGTSIAAGFSIAEGAMGLFGDENEELAKSIQKVTSAMAILNGLQEVRTILIEETTLATRAMTAAQALYTNVTKAAIVQTKLFRIALISTGIGALVVLIGLLVANWDKLGAAIGNSSFMLKRKNKLLEKNSDLNKIQIQLIEKRIELLGDETGKLDDLRKQREKEYKEEVKIQEERLKNQKKLLEETTDNYILTQRNITSSIPEAIFFGIFGASASDVQDAKQKVTEIELAYTEAIQNLENLQNEPTQNLINELERQKNLYEAQGRDTIEIERKILTETVKLYKDRTEEKKDAQNELDAFELRIIKEREDREKEEQERQKERLKELTQLRLEALQKELNAQGQYYEKLAQIRVVAGETGTPGIIQDIQNLIDTNETFIKSLEDGEKPLDNLIRTFNILNQNFNKFALNVRESLSSSQYFETLEDGTEVIRTVGKEFDKTTGKFRIFDEVTNKITGDVISLKEEFQDPITLEFQTSKGDEFAEFYDIARAQLTGIFLEGDRKKLEQQIKATFDYFEKEFKDTEGFFEKQRTLTSILDGYSRAFDLLNANTQTGVADGLEKYFDTLRDKLILEDVVKYDDVVDDELKNLLENGFLTPIGEISDDAVSQIERYGIDLERLRNGTENYRQESEKLLDYFILQETILKNQEGAFEGLNKEQKELLTQDIEGLAKIQLKAFEDTIVATTIIEDSIRGVTFEYQQYNNELLQQSKNADLIVGTIKSNFDEISKGFDFKSLIQPVDGEFEGVFDFEQNIDLVTKQLEKFGLDANVISEMTKEEQLRILKIFLDKGEELIKEEKKGIKELFEESIGEIYNELANLITSISDRITQNRIRNVELARDAELRAIDEVEQAYNEQQQNLTNAEKAQIVKEKEFADQRAAIQRKADEKILQLELKNAQVAWRLQLFEAVATNANNILKAYGTPPVPNFIAAGIAGSIGALQIGTLYANEPKKSDFQSFSTGGMVTGPGTSTSDSIPAYLSNGESVINAKSTAMFLPQLNAINQLGGGAPLIKGFKQGGFVSQSPTTIDTSGMEEIMMMMNNRPIKTYVVTQDITNAQHNEDVLKRRTTF